jgi:hypothetical protein
MVWEGNLRKLLIASMPNAVALEYTQVGANVLDPLDPFLLSDKLGSHVRIKFDGVIHCAATGKRIKRTYGDGLSYDAWLKSPQAVESVIRPELSRIHEGIALRDEEWERANHLVPHWVYLSQTSNLKVGVTGAHTGMKRWYDQGAITGTIVCIAPYRGLAGEMEVLLKEIFQDKTAYRGMLLAQNPEIEELENAREEAFDHLGTAFEDYMQFDAPVHAFHYPVLQMPKKVQSVRLDKKPVVEGKLVALKGQYMVLEDGQALNVRSHIGYRVQMEFS